MSNGKAPVCPISSSQILPGMPGVYFPHVPWAYDLPSAIAAANAAQQALQLLTGSGPGRNNTVSSSRSSSNNSGGGGGGGGAKSSGQKPGSKPKQDKGKKPPKKKVSRWAEVTKYRSKAKKKFYNPNDRDTWIEVEQINRMVWHDSVWGIDFVFTRQQQQSDNG